MLKNISIRGAREHNLKNVDVEIPRDTLTVLTGLSGSGKSSLAFDTIYAEGQRRYVESLSAYARQFLELMQKPDVDHIEGLSPAISIEQKTTSKNPRSTVGTVTEIYDYLRLLFARVGVPYSPATGLPIESQTVSQMADRILALPEGTRLYLLAPIVRGRKGEYRKELAELQKKGFQRAKVDGKYYELSATPVLDKKLKHDIEIVVDRIVVKPDIGNRLPDSIETALKLADGLLLVEFVPDESLTLRKGAVAPWAKSSSPYYLQTLEALARHYKFSMNEPWEDLPKKAQTVILHGSGDEVIKFTYDDGMRRYDTKKEFEGVIPNMDRRYGETDSAWVQEDLERFQSEAPCEDCQGYRLKPEALSVKIGGLHIGQVCEQSIRNADGWFRDIDQKLTKQQQEIASRILKEIRARLKFLNNVGLDYLTLARASGTLSGGESQRIRLASQIGSGLTGVLYVLDEPSIGLHQRDNGKLLQSLKGLRDMGNTVIVVEHDEDAIRQADHVIDMGPGAGVHGGHIIAEGTPADIIADKKSLTGRYLSGAENIPIPAQRRKPVHNRWLKVMGARGNNLKNVTAQIPLGTLTCITGVSGGGKSTLTIETLYKAAVKKLAQAREHPAPHDRIEGLEFLDKVIDIDQSPIGRTPRSNPATYTGAFTPIRDWFAELPESKARGYAPGRFSFNVKGGRCEACQGDGVIQIEMHFLPDVYVQCDVCKGKRYNRETLDVKFRDYSISDVLDMTIEAGAELFKAVPSIAEKLETLKRVGLGYISIGQQATTLSGGEAQRVKLSKELSRRATGRTLYILDEPTTGLHFHDVKKLLEVLQELVAAGNTVVVIEHNLEVIKTADWIVDLGPEGGDGGGEIVASGTPEDVAKNPRSYTGHYLKAMLKNAAPKRLKAAE